jgi:hypothetical protein
MGCLPATLLNDSHVGSRTRRLLNSSYIPKTLQVQYLYSIWRKLIAAELPFHLRPSAPSVNPVLAWYLRLKQEDSYLDRPISAVEQCSWIAYKATSMLQPSWICGVPSLCAHLCWCSVLESQSFSTLRGHACCRHEEFRRLISLLVN